IIKVYFQFKDFNKEVEKEFFEYLKTIKEAAWVVSCSGRWDALVAFWSRSSFHFHEYFIKILNRFSKHILHKEIVYNIVWFYYNRKWLMKEYTTPLAIRYGGEPGQYELDSTDAEILKMLAKNSRMPVVDIAKRIDQSSQNVINRMKKLEKDGIITKYSLNIDYKKIGYVFCKTFIYLRNITQKRLDELYKYCAAQPNIFALVTTAAAWDLGLEFEVENFEQMTEIMDSIRMKFSDIITNYESVIITKQSELNYIVE
ncbi:Lrp/AsnC family transcriptional regulator, partial [Candidatus Woesearchaeota archaeon]|nr:Lrp/AsnC family transcriptional regulator [Candidatus Woesearchaeota archaeon]